MRRIEIEGLSESMRSEMMHGAAEFKGSIGMGDAMILAELERIFGRIIDVRLKSLEKRMVVNVKKELSKVVSVMDFKGGLAAYEQDKERAENLEKVVNKLSVLYTKTSSPTILTADKKRLSREGQRAYPLITEALVGVSQYTGYKSVTRVANAKVYADFAKHKGVKPLVKRYATINGTAYQSVYADLLLRGLMPEFIRYVEQRFLGDERKAKQ